VETWMAAASDLLRASRRTLPTPAPFRVG